MVDKQHVVMISPYFFQYEVRPTSKNIEYAAVAGGLATVMVFAESQELARARAGRFVGRNNWEILEVKRVMLIQPHHIKNMDGVLKSVYLRAEQEGIAATFDCWKKSMHSNGSVKA
jgi:hypothetical protein